MYECVRLGPSGVPAGRGTRSLTRNPRPTTSDSPAFVLFRESRPSWIGLPIHGEATCQVWHDHIPEPTLLAVADHGEIVATLDGDTTDSDAVLAAMSARGVDIDTLAAHLQTDGARSFNVSWTALLADVAAKVGLLTPVPTPATKEK